KQVVELLRRDGSVAPAASEPELLARAVVGIDEHRGAPGYKPTRASTSDVYRGFRSRGRRVSALRPRHVRTCGAQRASETFVECARASRFWTRRILARSSRPSRRERGSTLRLEGRRSFVCTLFNRPSLVGPPKPTH